MRTIGMDEIRKISLEILMFFDDVCKRNDLRYSLAYGTLLGAIRHKGFIPWDDDIDVIMPREDYEKLISLDLETNKYKLINHKNHNRYFYLFSKIIDKDTTLIENENKDCRLGIYIDIFPIDYFDENNFFELAEKNKRYINNIYRLGFNNGKGLKGATKSFVQKAVLVIKNNLMEDLINEYELYIIEHTNSNGKNTGCFVNGGYGEGEFFEFDIFKKELIQVKFENHLFNAIQSYDYVLNRLYGNYLELPPVSKRRTHHNFIAYISNEQSR